MSRSLLALALCATAAYARGEYEDETHPRSPGTPLEIVFRPYQCAACVEEGIQEGEAADIEMMRLPVAQLAQRLGIRKDWYAIQTPNFKIFSTLEATRVKLKDNRFIRADLERLKEIFPKLGIGLQGAALDAHQRAHLYHIRAERLFSHFRALTGNEQPFLGMDSRFQMYLFAEYEQHHAFVDQFVGLSNDKKGVNWHVKEKPNFLLVTVAESMVRGDARFHGHWVHNLAHNLIDGYGGYYRETWGWLEEGLAHYYERRENPAHNTFCDEEGAGAQYFDKEEWDKGILNLVRRGKDTPFPEWCEKLRPGELTPYEHGFAWSIVQWMIETDPIRLAKVIDKLQDYKNKPNATQCIEFGFGVGPMVIHQRWKEYVEEEYGKRK